MVILDRVGRRTLTFAFAYRQLVKRGEFVMVIHDRICGQTLTFAFASTASEDSEENLDGADSRLHGRFVD